jgi:hypothetical protein
MREEPKTSTMQPTDKRKRYLAALLAGGVFASGSIASLARSSEPPSHGTVPQSVHSTDAPDKA